MTAMEDNPYRSPQPPAEQPKSATPGDRPHWRKAIVEGALIGVFVGVVAPVLDAIVGHEPFNWRKLITMLVLTPIAFATIRLLPKKRLT
jgi:hypothetical protein